MRFEFPFNLISKWTMGFFNRQIMARTQILYTGGDLEQGFRRCVTDGHSSRFWNRLDEQ